MDTLPAFQGTSYVLRIQTGNRKEGPFKSGSFAGHFQVSFFFFQRRNRPGDGPRRGGEGWGLDLAARLWCTLYIHYASFLPQTFYSFSLSLIHQPVEFPHTITIDKRFSTSLPPLLRSVSGIPQSASRLQVVPAASPPVHQPWKRPWRPRSTALPMKNR
ncbi:hypothetical protein LZ32DRAFT_138458 [Colletotrichum eremochloae]|nr:hypothetical protein LZ32DRAFT_138458 [Colletotrichum eremochloae]